jgi:hypothetical protein
VTIRDAPPPPRRGLPSRGRPHPVRAALLKSPESLPARAALLLASLAAVTFFLLSYSHRWVWCVPALLTLAALGVRHRSRLSLAVAATGLAVFAAAPQLWFPHGRNAELRWAAWQQAVGCSHTLFAAIILLLAAAAAIFPAAGVPGTVCTRSSADGAPQPEQ